MHSTYCLSYEPSWVLLLLSLLLLLCDKSCSDPIPQHPTEWCFREAQYARVLPSH
jgi:hypothetical protein